MEGGRKLKQHLGPFGGREATGRFGSAPLEPGFLLDWIDEQDISHLREALDWGSGVVGGGGRGWMTGAQPLGIPIVFSGMPPRSPSISLTCMTPGDPAKVDRYLRRNPPAIAWATIGTVTRDHVYIQTRVDASNGITVRQLTDEILGFAKRIKALDIY